MSLNLKKFTLAIAILAVQNICIFHAHYFQNAGFPWDFSNTYFAVPYYWITSLQNGVFPEWIPFQAVGYPLGLNLQSGLFYPPLYFFVLTGLPFTFSAAVILQCLHLLFGALGMLCLLKRLGVQNGYALIGAVAFQFFGGFYSNAEHMDIVRGYAFTPWLLAGLVSPWTSIAARFLIPSSIFMFFVGAYPGQIIAAMFTSALYVLFNTSQSTGRFPEKVKHAANGFGLLALGAVLGSVHFLPAFLLRNDLARNGDALANNMNVTALDWSHFLTLFEPSNSSNLTNDVSMRSLYVTLPLVALLFFLGRATAVRRKDFLFILCIACLMITASPFYTLCTRLLGMLKLSRFPSADYRALVVVPLIVLAVSSLEQTDAIRFIRTRAAALLAILIGANVVLLLDTPNLLLAIAIAAVAAALFFLRTRMPTALVITVFVTLISVDACRVLRDQSTWKSAPLEATLEKDTGINLLQSRAGLTSSITSGPDQRPDRNITAHEFYYSHIGYLTGRYMMQDYSGGMQLASTHKILSDPTLRSYAAQAWRPILLPAAPSEAILKQAILEPDITQPGFAVTSLRYLPNTVTYSVLLSEPRCLIENEKYFKGWTAHLSNGVDLEAIDSSAFRAWKLPAGNYTMTAQFKMPYLRLSAGLSALAALFWAWILFSAIRQSRRHSQPADTFPVITQP